MRRLLLLATVLATLLAGGCGIPSDGDVTLVGPGRTSGISAGDDDQPPEHSRESTYEQVKLVEYYLEAAAGDPDAAVARARAFMAPGAAAKFQPGSNEVRVVRLLATPLFTPGVKQIGLDVQQTGTLNTDGVFTPANPAPPPARYEIEVDTQPDHPERGLFIWDAPPFLMMSDTALDTYYQPKPIYWWNTENTGLVPDMRYMPRSVPTVQRPTTVLGWLAGGPADWLKDVVRPWPQGTTVPDNVPAPTNNELEISLSPAAVPPNDPQQLDRLRRQLQWSLLTPRDEQVALQLTIGRQDPVRYAEPDYLDSNPAYRLADNPDKFVIYDGAIRRLADSPNQNSPIPVLKPEANRAVASAALSASRTHTFAAVVTGTGSGQRLRVAMAPQGGQADLTEVPGLTGELGRPQWVSTPDDDARAAFGLIIVGGKLFTFRPDDSPAEPVQWLGAPGPITSVSVAPDGRRVAMVVGGKLFRTVLDVSGDGLTLGNAEQVRPPTLRTVAAVAWTSEIYLAVAGQRAGDGRYSVIDVTSDGALDVPGSGLSDIGTQPVTHLVAYPANPITFARNLGVESYETAGAAWTVVGPPPDRIKVTDLAGPPPAGPAKAAPVAPFFLR